MKPHTLLIPAEVHGRVLVREASRSPAPLLVGFHGYTGNGEQFMEALEQIPGTGDWHLVAIQALHPFYDRKGETVVASWMTRQDRDLAISDNIAYVSRAMEEVGRHVDHVEPTVFLGFSQGVAMAYRAACFLSWKCDAVIALGGDVPADVAGAPAGKIPSVLVGRGKSDAWYDEPKFDQDLARLHSMGSSVETCLFDGGHDWTDAFRNAAGAYLERQMERSD